ncbi:VWA domain-containing protein [uncultured Roseibium sp.]|uniref:vWA domain-containing protein n=1 Tax=uncultured Roseibium sp. TaxID=1936171 RepID=UPI00262025F9|nr:VWA domain-containing protein [uncultured Roseibium sp.]
MFRPLIFAVTALSIFSTSSQAADKVAIVFDGSGSMWGQIEGRTKIEIARDAMSNVLGTLPGDLELGLFAYGHRQKGKCDDIELIVPPAAGTGAAIKAATDNITPKGKTPLSAAVRQAAETMRYTEDRATVVLVTDGIETCNADPCALGQELARLGINFTAHVIGFGLSPEEGRQVACLAENTGGLYIQAGNAEELSGALTATVETAPVVEAAAQPAQLPEASLAAPDTAEIGARIDVSWQGPGGRYDQIELHDPQARGGEGKRLRSKAVVNGDLENNTVAMTVVSEPGTYELRYWDGSGRQILATRAIEVTPAEVALFAPDEIAMARPVTVEWVGPGGRYDAVELYDASARGGEGKVLHNKRLRNDDFDNNKVTMPTPAKPGTYQLRYYAGEDKIVLATRPLDIIEAQVTLETDEAAEAGKPILVDWVGPGARYDSVRLVDPASGKKIHEKRLRNDDFDNQRVTLPGPVKAGPYELHYYNGDNKTVLATVPIAVTAAVVALQAPDQIGQGRHITVTWTGPGARYDSVQFFDPRARAGDGRVVHQKRLRNDDFDNSKVTLPSAAKPGDYELRYYNGDNKTVMLTRPISVVPVELGVDGPESVEAETTFSVSWKGPGARYDSVQIWDPRARGGNGRAVFERRVWSGDIDAQTVNLKAPKEAGNYEIRYFNGDNKAVLFTRPLSVQ